MSYNLTALTDIAACDRVLEQVRYDRKGVAVRKTNMDFVDDGTTLRAPKVEARIADLQLRIDGLAAQLLVLPEGNARKDKDDELQRAQTQQRDMLRWKRKHYGEQSSVDELEEDLIDDALARYDTFLAEVEALKATLTV